MKKRGDLKRFALVIMLVLVLFSFVTLLSVYGNPTKTVIALGADFASGGGKYIVPAQDATLILRSREDEFVLECVEYSLPTPIVTFYSDIGCLYGMCDTPDISFCGGEMVQYYFDSGANRIEVAWEIDIDKIHFDDTESDSIVTSTTAQADSITVDAMFTEMYGIELVGGMTVVRTAVDVDSVVQGEARPPKQTPVPETHEPVVSEPAVTEPESSPNPVTEPESSPDPVTEPESSPDPVTEPETTPEPITQTPDPVTEPETTPDPVTELEFTVPVEPEQTQSPSSPSVPEDNSGENFSGQAVCDGGATPCSCGDVIVADVTLDGADPITAGVCGVGIGGLAINGNDVTLDCNGYTIEGADGDTKTGISILAGRTGAIIKNCNVVNWLHGVRAFGDADGSQILTSNFTSNYHGIYLRGVNLVINQSLVQRSNATGIYVESPGVGSSLVLENTFITNNTQNGMNVTVSSVIARNNTFLNNSPAGIAFYSTDRSLIVNNTIHHNVGYGIWGDTNSTFIGNNSIRHNNLTGIFMRTARNVTIDNNVIDNHTRGIQGFFLNTSSISNNTIENSSVFGIILSPSTNTYLNITDNKMKYNNISILISGLKKEVNIHNNTINESNVTGLYVINSVVNISGGIFGRTIGNATHIESSSAHIEYVWYDRNANVSINIVDSENVTIKDCNFTLGRTAIFAKDSNNITIDGVVIANNVPQGFVGETLRNLTIKESVFGLTGIFIALSQPTIHINLSDITGGILSNNSFSWGNFSIYAKDSQNITIDNSSFTNSNDAALYTDAVADNHINNCSFVENNVSLDLNGAGVFVNNTRVRSTRGTAMTIRGDASLRRLVLENSIIANNWENALNVSYAFVWAKNTSFNNNTDGIYFESSLASRISNCSIIGNAQQGIKGTTNLSLITSNIIRNNTLYGINIVDSEGVTVSGNEIENSSIGVRGYFLNTSVITRNIIENTTKRAVSLTALESTGMYTNITFNNFTFNNISVFITNYADKVILFGNSINDSASAAVSVTDSNVSMYADVIENTRNEGAIQMDPSDVLIENVTIRGSVGPCVNISSSTHVRILGSNITNCTDGVILTNVENSTIINSNISFNSRSGVFIDRCSNVSVKNSSMHNNTFYGVYVFLSDNVTLEADSIVRNELSGVFMVNTFANITATNISRSTQRGILSYNSVLNVSYSNFSENGLGSVGPGVLFNNTNGTFFRTLVSNNTGSGIFLTDRCDFSILESNMTYNKLDGLYSDLEVFINTSKSNFSENARYGMYMTDTNITVFTHEDIFLDNYIVDNGFGKMRVDWYMQVNVTNISFGPVENAAVNISDSREEGVDGAVYLFNFTDATGATEIKPVLEFVVSNTGVMLNETVYILANTSGQYDFSFFTINQSMLVSRGYPLQVNLDVFCGDYIINSTVLWRNVTTVDNQTCPGVGLYIHPYYSGQQVHLHVNNKEIRGSGSNNGIQLTHTDEYVRIYNARISDFANGVFAYNSSGAFILTSPIIYNSSIGVNARALEETFYLWSAKINTSDQGAYLVAVNKSIVYDSEFKNLRIGLNVTDTSSKLPQQPWNQNDLINCTEKGLVLIRSNINFTKANINGSDIGAFVLYSNGSINWTNISNSTIAGVYVQDSQGFVVANNELEGNDRGVWVNSIGVYLENNSYFNNTGEALLIGTDANNTYSDEEIFSNNNVSIFISSFNNTFYRPTINESIALGVRVSGGSANLTAGNLHDTGLEGGIDIDNSMAVIEHMTIKNASIAINATNSYNLLVQANSMTSGVWQAVFLANVENSTIRSNNFWEILNDSIIVGVGRNITIIYNSFVSSTTGRGVNASSLFNSLIQQNQYEEPSKALFLRNSENITIFSDWYSDIKDGSITLRSSNNISVVNCTIGGSDGYAVSSISSSNITLQTNSIKSTLQGTYIFNSHDVLINNTNITWITNGIGLLVYNSGLDITGSNISDVRTTHGLWMNNTNLTLINSTVFNNFGYGIYFVDRSNVTIYDSNITWNHQPNIRGELLSYLTLSRNNISNTSSYSIWLIDTNVTGPYGDIIANNSISPENLLGKVRIDWYFQANLSNLTSTGVSGAQVNISNSAKSGSGGFVYMNEYTDANGRSTIGTVPQVIYDNNDAEVNATLYALANSSVQYDFSVLRVNESKMWVRGNAYEVNLELLCGEYVINSTRLLRNVTTATNGTCPGDGLIIYPYYGEIVLDANNKYIYGSGTGNGIQASNIDQYLRVIDARISNFENGVFAFNSSDSVILTDPVIYDTSIGVFAHDLDQIFYIWGAQIENVSEQGAYIFSANQSLVYDTTIKNARVGLNVTNSFGRIPTQPWNQNNLYNCSQIGVLLANSNINFTNSNINGSDIGAFVLFSNGSINWTNISNSTTAGVYVQDSRGFVVANNELEGNDRGVWVNSEGILLEDNLYFNNSGVGLLLSAKSNNTVAQGEVYERNNVSIIITSIGNNLSSQTMNDSLHTAVRVVSGAANFSNGNIHDSAIGGGFDIDGASDVFIDSMIVRNHSVAMNISNSDNIYLYKNDFQNNWHSVELANVENSTFDDNDFFNDLNDSILVIDGRNLTISKNEITGGTNQRGLNASGLYNSLIWLNFFEESSQAVYLLNSENISLMGNTFSDIQSGSITARSCKNVSIYNGSIGNSDGYIASIISSSNVSLNGINGRGCVKGAYVFNSYDINFNFTNISWITTGLGLLAFNSEIGMFDCNISDMRSATGISVNNTNISIVNSTISGSAGIGVNFVQRSNVTILDSNITNNGGQNVKGELQSYVVLRGNNISNSSYSVYLIDTNTSGPFYNIIANNSIGTDNHLGKLRVDWYLQVNVTNSTGEYVVGAAVNVTSSSGESAYGYSFTDTKGISSLTYAPDFIVGNDDVQTDVTLVILSNTTQQNDYATLSVNESMLKSIGNPFVVNLDFLCGELIVQDTKLSNHVLTADGNGCDATGLTISTSNIKLDCAGFDINGTMAANSVGIALANKVGVVIENCSVYNFTTGLYGNNISNAFVKNSTVSGNEVGLYVINSSNLTVLYTDLLNNSQHGLRLINVLQGSLDRDNFGLNNITAILFENATSLSINKSNFTGNDQRTIWGFDSTFDLIDNNISENSDSISYPTVQLNRTNGTIVNNTFFNNTGAAIYLTDESNFTIAQNNITFNNFTAIYTEARSFVVVSGNNISANKRYGIHLVETNTTSRYYDLILNNDMDNQNEIAKVRVDYYIQLNVTNEVGPVGQARVNISAGTTNFVFAQTDANGYSPMAAATDFFINNSDSQVNLTLTLAVNTTSQFKQAALRLNYSRRADTGNPYPFELVLSAGDVISTNLTLNKNLYAENVSDGLIIGQDGITIDCNGSTINGSGGGNGIRIVNYENVSIVNCMINNFTNGLYAFNANGLHVYNTTLGQEHIGIEALQSTNLRIDNISVYNATSDGISLLGVNNSNITNVILRFNNGSGINMSRSYANLVFNNTILNNSYIGIYMVGLTDGNNISNNSVASNNYTGILVTGNNNTIEHNIVVNNSNDIYMFNTINTSVYQNTLSTGEYCLRMIEANYSRLLENVYSGCGLAGLAVTLYSDYNNLSDEAFDLNNISIMIRNSSNNTFERVVVNNSNASGVLIFASHTVFNGGTVSNTNLMHGFDIDPSPTVIENMSINNNTGAGVNISFSSNIIIRNNNISSNSGHGISLIVVDNSTIINNNISLNARDGIYLLGCENITIDDVIVSNNSWVGLRGISVYNLSVDTSVFTQNNMSGVLLSAAVDVNFTSVNITLNMQRGIFGVGVNKLNVLDSNISWNGDNIILSGIDLNNTNATLINSTLYNNTASGIFMVDKSNLTILDSDLTFNQYDGISSDADSYVLLRGNNLSSNGRYGVFFTDTTTEGPLYDIVLNNSIDGSNGIAKMRVDWYLQFNISNMTSAAIDAVVVNVSNSPKTNLGGTSVYMYEQTDGNGRTPWNSTPDFIVNNSDVIINYTVYIFAEKGTQYDFSSIRVNESKLWGRGNAHEINLEFLCGDFIVKNTNLVRSVTTATNGSCPATGLHLYDYFDTGFVLDGNHFNITGQKNGYGINMTNFGAKSYVQNVNVSNFTNAIFLTNGTNMVFFNLYLDRNDFGIAINWLGMLKSYNITIDNSTDTGMLLINSNFSHINNFVMRNNRVGINMTAGFGNPAGGIANLTLFNSTIGISASRTGVNVTGSIIRNCTMGVEMILANGTISNSIIANNTNGTVAGFGEIIGVENTTYSGNDYGLWVSASHNTKLSDNYYYENIATALVVSGANYVNSTGEVYLRNNMSMFIGNAFNMTIVNVNSTEANHTGIRFTSASGNVSGGIIKSTNIDGALDIDGSPVVVEYVFITNNTVGINATAINNLFVYKSNFTSNWQAIVLNTGFNSTIANSNLWENLNESLLILSGDNITIEYNQFVSSTQIRGINASAFGNSMIRQNIFEENSQAVYLFNSENISFLSNDYNDIKDGSVTARLCKNITIENESIGNSDGYAISIISSSNVTEQNVYIKGNALGSYVFNSYDVLVNNSNISRVSTGIGLLSFNSQLDILYSNVSDSQTGNGLSLNNSNVTVTNSTIKGNSGFGVYFVDRSNLTVENSTIVDNGGNNIRGELLSYVLLSGNNVSNSTYGVYLIDTNTSGPYYDIVLNNTMDPDFHIGKLRVDWYVQANVTNRTKEYIVGAAVNVTSSTGESAYGYSFTDAEGISGISTVPQFSINNSDVQINASFVIRSNNTDQSDYTVVRVNESRRYDRGNPYVVSFDILCGEYITRDTKLANHTLTAEGGVCEGTGLYILGDYITLDCSGFDINGTRAGADVGISVNDKLNVTIGNCSVNNFTTGIYENNVTISLLKNISLHDNGAGAYMLNSVNLSGVDLLVFNNTQYGLRLLDTDGAEFSYVDVMYNNISGVFFDNVSSIVFNYSNFSRGTQHGIWGFKSVAKLSWNNISENGNGFVSAGVQLNGSNGTISNNTIFNNTGAGIYMLDHCNYTILDNNITYNNFTGITSDYQGFVVLEGNNVSANARYGMHLIDTNTTSRYYDLILNNDMDNQNELGKLRVDWYIQLNVTNEIGPVSEAQTNISIGNSLYFFERTRVDGYTNISNAPDFIINNSDSQNNFTLTIVVNTSTQQSTDLLRLNYSRLVATENPLPVSFVLHAGDVVVTNLTLNKDLYAENVSDGLIVGKSGITIDCNGTTINGTGDGNGIRIVGHHNVSINHCKIFNFTNGLLLSNANGAYVYNTTLGQVHMGIEAALSKRMSIDNISVFNATGDAISLLRVNDSNITNNMFRYSNRSGINISRSLRNLIFNNTILNNSYTGIYMYATASQTNISNNSIASNNYTGIWMVGNNNTVEHNLIVNNSVGVYSSSGINNTVVRNVLIGGDRGIWFVQTNYSVTQSNTIMSSKVSAISVTLFSNHNNFSSDWMDLNNNSIVVTNSTDDRFSNMVINNSNATGVRVVASEVFFYGGSVTNTNQMHGFDIDPSPTLIENMSVVNNSGSGINISNSANVVIRNNNVTANKGYGISLIVIENSSVYNNNVSWNVRDGMLLLGCANVTTYDNIIANNTKAGVTILLSDNITVENTVIWSNNYSGILFNEVVDLNITDSNISWNIQRGIVGFGSVVNIVGNNISENGDAQILPGIQLNNTNGSIFNNTIYNNTAAGIFIEDRCNVSIASNNITHNKFDGIQSDLETYLIVSGNNISGSGRYGLYLSDTNVSGRYYDLVLNNTMDNNTAGKVRVDWHLQVNVTNNTGEYIANATVNMTTSSGEAVYGVSLTDAFGRSNVFSVPQFVINNTDVQVNYTVIVLTNKSTQTDYASLYVNRSQRVDRGNPYQVNLDVLCDEYITRDISLLTHVVSAGNTACGQYGLRVVVDDVTVDCNGLDVNGSMTGNSTGVYIANRNNVTLIDCNVGNFTYGLYGNNASNIKLIDSKFLLNDYGMYVRNTTNYTINGTSVVNNSQYGGYSANIEGFTIENSWLRLNNISGMLMINVTANVSGSNVTGNSQRGLWAYDSRVSVIDCNISENLDGVTLPAIQLNNSNGTIVNNTIRNNSGWGIYAIDRCNITVENNSVLYNNQDGIYVELQSYVDLRDNNVSGNKRYGVLLADSNVSSGGYWDIVYNNSVDSTNVLGKVRVDWYVQARVLNETSAAVSGASVFFSTNVTGVVATNITDANGLTEVARTPRYLMDNGVLEDLSTTIVASLGSSTGWVEFDVNDSLIVTRNDAVNLTIKAPSGTTYISGNYTMNDNFIVNGTAFMITADNTTLDCNGSAIIGNGSGFGIYMSGMNNVNVWNCTILNFSIGIGVNDSDLIALNNNVSFINGTGLYAASNANVSSFNSSYTWSSGAGIALTYDSWGYLTDNYFYNNSYGVWVADSNTSVAIEDLLLSNEIRNQTSYKLRNDYSLQARVINSTNGNVSNATLRFGFNLSTAATQSLTDRFGVSDRASMPQFVIDNDNRTLDVTTRVSATYFATSAISYLVVNHSYLFVDNEELVMNVSAIECGATIEGNVTLTGPIRNSTGHLCNGTALTIIGSQTTLNCNNTILGSSDLNSDAFAIEVVGASNVFIVNCTTGNFSRGIRIQDSNSVSLRSVNFSEPRIDGLLVNNSDDVTIWQSQFLAPTHQLHWTADSNNGFFYSNKVGGTFSMFIENGANLFTANNTFEHTNGTMKFAAGYWGATADVNFSRDYRLSYNLLYVNSTLSPDLNKSALVYFSGVWWDIPIVVKRPEGFPGFVLCNEPDCYRLGFANGSFLFNVTSFSAYRSISLKRARLIRLIRLFKSGKLKEPPAIGTPPSPPPAPPSIAGKLREPGAAAAGLEMEDVRMMERIKREPPGIQFKSFFFFLGVYFVILSEIMFIFTNIRGKRLTNSKFLAMLMIFGVPLLANFLSAELGTFVAFVIIGMLVFDYLLGGLYGYVKRWVLREYVKELKAKGILILFGIIELVLLGLNSRKKGGKNRRR